MEYNLITNLSTCQEYVSELSGLVYYSHIPTALIGLVMSLYVLWKSKGLLTAKILFVLTFVFALWSAMDLVTWTSYDSRAIMLSWSMLNLLDFLFYLLTFYFVYVFIEKKDLSMPIKAVFLLIVIFIAVLTPTYLNLTGFDVGNCESIENSFLWDVTFYSELVLSAAIVGYLFFRFITRHGVERKKVGYLMVGTSIFLLSFFVAVFLANNVFDNFDIEQYGLFGMPIFIAMLAYIIVKYEVFNIKLIGAQALVFGLFLLIGSQFFFIRNFTNRILTGVTLLLITVFGWWLVRAVKDEIKKKEELADMTEKLGVAYEKMKQLDRAKSEFVSIASHQLRTPLTSIKGFISLVLEGSYGRTTRAVREVLEKVYVSNERLIRLVEDLLNISRIESGRLVFKFEKNDVGKMVADIVESMSFAAKNKGLYLDLKLPKNPVPEFVFDKDKLREVVTNLIDNAIKYTKKGGITVSLREVDCDDEGVEQRGDSEIVMKYKCTRPGKYVQIIVADTGIGIKPGEEKYIFEKFQRGKDINRVHTEGIGLGLYVAEKIIQAHRARIWAESGGIGKGSRFAVELDKNFVVPPAEVGGIRSKVKVEAR